MEAKESVEELRRKVAKLETELNYYQAMEKSRKCGWWRLDLGSGRFTCSPFLHDLYGVYREEISTSDFHKLLSEKENTRIQNDKNEILNNPDNQYRRFYRLSSPTYGAVDCCSDVAEVLVGQGENGGDVMVGYTSILEKDFDTHVHNDSSNFIQMLSRQKNITDIMLTAIRYEDYTQAFFNILQEILVVFDSQIAMIYSLDESEEMAFLKEYAVDEATHIDLSAIKTLPKSAIPWCIQKLNNGENVIINSPEEVKDCAPAEYHNLTMLGMQSAIFIPLFSAKNTIGFIGIDNREQHTWSGNDIKWLSTVANIVNLMAQVLKNKDNAKRYNEELNSRKRYLESLLSQIPMAISIYDVNHQLQYFNQKFSDIFGIIDSEEIIGKPFFSKQCSKERMNVVYSEDASEHNFDYDFDKVEHYHTSRKGQIRLSLKVVKLYDGNGRFYGHLNMCLEDTDRLLAINQIHDFEYFFSVISDFAKIGYVKFDLLNMQGYAIKQWYKNMGERENTPLDEIVLKYKHFHPDDRNKYITNILNVKAGKSKSFQMEARVRPYDAKDDSWKWLRIYVIVINYKPQDERIELISVNYDITETKNTAIDLRKARDKAQENDRLKSAFLANMSHEIRTPLNAIVGFSNLLCDDIDDDARQESRDIISDNSKLLLQLISDILDLSKMESNTMLYDIKPFDVNKLCNTAVLSLKDRTSEGVKLVFDKSEDECTMVSDPIRVQQLLTNFLTNAIKHTVSGTITLGYSIRDKNISFYVSDTGSGIPKDKQKLIFDRFVKLDNFVPGTGLGLSICKNIAHQLGGKITVTSEVGKGSTFKFTLPINKK